MVLIPQNLWEQHHYRFGLAGEGQADIIERHLRSRKGWGLNIGCGPQGTQFTNLAAFCTQLVAADQEYGMLESAARDRVPRNVSFVVADAHHLPFIASSFSHVLALGLFAYIQQPEIVFREFRRILDQSGTITVTNSVARPKAELYAAAVRAGLHLVDEAEGLCPAASGPTKRRYICVFKVRTRILFVCAGNTCRSPMAEAVARQLLGSAACVESAGIEADEGAQASKEAIRAMRERGLDISRHRSRALDRLDLMEFDLLIGLTPRIARELHGRGLDESKVRALDIPDPYGRGIEVYRETVVAIESELQRVFGLGAKESSGK